MTLPELFSGQVAATPEAVAVRCGDQLLSYRALDARSDALADRIDALLPGPDAVVAVLMERSTDLIVTLLAVLKAGGAYLALDPASPQAHTARLLADAAPAAVVTTAALRERLPRQQSALLLADEAPTDAPVPRRRAPLLPDNLAYVSYTSGSTGAPKGVAVTHRGVVRLVSRPDWISWTPQDTFLQLAPVAFDASTWEIWAPLTSGATLAVAPAGPVTSDMVAETVRGSTVTVLWLTAGLFRQIADDRPEALSGVRHLLAGGDVVSSAHLGRVLRQHPGLTFTNGYGPTENTTFTTCWTTAGEAPKGAVPIGRPISGTRVAVLDDDLRPVLKGAVGELYAGGDGLARGYLNQPQQTALRFVPDPDPRYPGERLYRTGDLVRTTADGVLEFVGRADDQVKVNGYRVEPAEAEAVLRGFAGVNDAVVTAERAANGQLRLVAHLVPEDGTDGEALRRRLSGWLRERLPAYLVPSAVALLPRLPLTANGKVDRALLPPTQPAPRDVDSVYAPPRTAVETELVGLWQHALAVEPVGIHDDFFELGGHSLLAADLVREVRRTLGVELSAETFYLRPTVAELAEVLEREQEAV